MNEQTSEDDDLLTIPTVDRPPTYKAHGRDQWERVEIILKVTPRKLKCLIDAARNPDCPDEWPADLGWAIIDAVENVLEKYAGVEITSVQSSRVRRKRDQLTFVDDPQPGSDESTVLVRPRKDVQ